MNRCQPKRALLALAASLALCAGTLLLTAPAAAQGIVREAPKDVKLAQLHVLTPPDIAIDGKPDRLSPGSRIRDLNNFVVLSGSLAGKTVPVVYRRDAAGLVHEAWILSPDEYAKLSGASGGAGSEGVQQFIDMLALIFGARR
jgi:hypothetical protein